MLKTSNFLLWWFSLLPCLRDSLGHYFPHDVLKDSTVDETILESSERSKVLKGSLIPFVPDSR